MKFARRSVSDQDIRRYEMFAQVYSSPNATSCYYSVDLNFIRTCNNPVRSVQPSNFPKVRVALPPGMAQLPEAEQTRALVKILQMTTYMPEGLYLTLFFPFSCIWS